MSWDLCFKILDHLKELGLLRDGDMILDPMAGTGRTAIAACSLGYRAVTVELEEKFIGFERQNLEYASRKLNRQLDWTILQGDARKLSGLLQERGLRAVMSPPYESVVSDQPVGRTLVERRIELGRDINAPGWSGLGTEYGSTPGQIGNLKDRPLKAVMSPPYETTMNDPRHRASFIDGSKSLDWHPGPNSQVNQHQNYGATPGQIGNMPDRPLKCVTSPPYIECGAVHSVDNTTSGIGRKDGKPRGGSMAASYGVLQAPEQILGDASYLEAMRQVYAEIGKVADVLAAVTKNPLRAGKLRDLCGDTIALLKQTGWTICCHHKAILFEEQETTDLFGQGHKKPKGRLSFFKRLSYQKGSPVANHEDILVCVKEKEE